MGCDIHSHAERKENEKWIHLEITPFDWRSYGMYGFLAGVRNYSDVTPISLPRGMPDTLSQETKEDYERWDVDAHSASWLSLEELLAFNYDQLVEDRRVTKQLAPNIWHGGCTSKPGGGEMTTYRKFLGETFFTDLEKLKASGAERIVFWFDN